MCSYCLDRIGNEGRRPTVGAEIDAHRVQAPALGQQVQLGTSVTRRRDDERALFGERTVMASPIPLPAPVTTATLPVRLSSTTNHLCCTSCAKVGPTVAGTPHVNT